MPELPEVEVVRLGLESHIVGTTIESVEVLHPRAVRRHIAGGKDLEGQLRGCTIAAAQRRGKYLWLPLESRDRAIVVHLGMSGQMLVQPPTVPDEKHLRIRARLDNGADLRFVDQRTFGGWALAPLLTVDGESVPEPVAHIARDPVDPLFDAETVVNMLRAKHTEIKRALLDQTVLSGVGNIYASEALFGARIRPTTPSGRISRPRMQRLVAEIKAVLQRAIDCGGTTINDYLGSGDGGRFQQELAVYGRAGEGCIVCDKPITNKVLSGRSTFYCTTCQH